MENHKDLQKTQLDNYLDQLREKEKRSYKQKLLLLFAAIVAVSGSVGAYYLVSTRSSGNVKDFRYEDAYQLSVYKVDSMFKTSALPIIVSNSIKKTMDTVHSVDEYLRLELNLAASEQSLQIDDISSAETLTFPDSAASIDNSEEEEIKETTKEKPIPKKPMRQYLFDIAGKRTQGELLTFSVEGYDPKIRYVIDFGNGKKQRIYRKQQYTYSRAGTYKPTLIATNAEGNSRMYSKTLVIEKTAVIQASNKKPVTLNQSKSENLSAEQDKLSENTDRSPMPLVADDAVASSEETSNKPASLSNTPSEMKAPVSSNRPLKFAEVMPSFPGGSTAMYTFLNKKLNYPDLARENEIEGKVYVQFIVRADGSFDMMKVVKGIGYGCDEEAIRVIRSMPKWNAGIHKGQKVPVVYTLPVRFRLR